MNIVRRADEAFTALPADIRGRVSNDPQQLMDFVDNDLNREKARRLGLTRTLSDCLCFSPGTRSTG